MNMNEKVYYLYAPEGNERRTEMMFSFCLIQIQIFISVDLVSESGLMGYGPNNKCLSGLVRECFERQGKSCRVRVFPGFAEFSIGKMSDLPPYRSHPPAMLGTMMMIISLVISFISLNMN